MESPPIDYGFSNSPLFPGAGQPARGWREARGKVAIRTQSVLYSGSEQQEQKMTQGTVQLVAGILAVVLIAIVILRRKGKKSKSEEEF
jgi:hypothetical protein